MELNITLNHTLLQDKPQGGTSSGLPVSGSFLEMQSPSPLYFLVEGIISAFSISHFALHDRRVWGAYCGPCG